MASQPFELPACVEIPPVGSLLDTLVEDHPRLLADAQTFEQLQRDVAEIKLMQTWATALYAQADALLDLPPQPYEIPDGKRLLEASREILHRTYTLAMAYRLAGQQAWRDRLWSELAHAAGFKDWNPSHFLDTAEMMHALAIGYDWLYHDWTHQQRVTLSDAIWRHGLEPAQRSYAGKSDYGWWTQAKHNWNQVCNGGIGLAALALADERQDEIAMLLHHALVRLPQAMQHFAPDGAWFEGPGYWRYAVQYNVAILAACQTALGNDFGLSDMPGFSMTGDMMIYLHGPTGQIYNFADAHNHFLVTSTMFWLASRFDRPDYAHWHTPRARPNAEDLLWYDQRLLKASAEPPVLDKHFDEVDIASMRSAWNDPNATFVGIKAGRNGVNHDNLDLGSFILETHGQRFLDDLGRENYNLPGYFGALRYTYYRLRAESHNTLVINPSQGPDQSPAAACPIVEFVSKPDHAIAMIDLTSAYPEAKVVTRRLRMDRADVVRVTLTDDIALNEPGEIWWFVTTSAAIELADDARSAQLMLDGQMLRIALAGPGQARFQTMPARPLSTSPNPDGQNANEGYTKLAIHLVQVHETRIVVTFEP